MVFIWTPLPQMISIVLLSALTVTVTHNLIASGKYTNLGPSSPSCSQRYMIPFKVAAAVRSSV